MGSFPLFGGRWRAQLLAAVGWQRVIGGQGWGVFGLRVGLPSLGRSTLAQVGSGRSKQGLMGEVGEQSSAQTHLRLGRLPHDRGQSVDRALG